MGRPGSGKGTQAQLLRDKLDCRYFSTGDAFRTLAAQDTPLGARTNNLISRGKLMPHWFASYLVNDTIFNLADDETVVLDGTNRTLPEAELFYDVMAWLERPYRLFHLDVSEKVITNRILSRAKESNRTDDTRESIAMRINEYDENTEPALAFLAEKGLVIRLDGEQSVDAIQETILTHLGLA